MKKVLTLLMVLAATCALAEKLPYERYESVVNRQMFGPLPAGFDPTKMPSEVQKTGRAEEKQLTQEQQKIKQSIRFSVIDVRPDGTVKVGFTDMSDAKNPQSYFLAVGESNNGWLVKDADPDESTMLIEKDGIELELALGQDSKSTDKVKAAGNDSALLNSNMSLRKRRRHLEEQEARAAKEREEEKAARAEKERQEAMEKAEREEKDAQEKEAQREQLKAIQEELKRAREEKEKAAEKEKSENDQDDAE